MRTADHYQCSIEDLGTGLHAQPFVVIDLETTGGRPADAGITEIGAVKVLGGEVIGEFGTLVNPGEPIPAFIAALTGITDGLVADAPRLGAVLPGLLAFIGDAVVVAHNAPYDISFLKGACVVHDQPWPAPRVVDTARMARTCLHRDEVRNCKLSTLAAHFRTQVSPSHRALDDARATTEVFHALLERAAGFGVATVEDLVTFTSRVSSQQRAKRHLADGLPDSPGVYVFTDAQGAALYVGRSTSIRRRVRSYFTASETRRRMAEMIGIATCVTAIPCATALEAQVREVRMIASEQPRYNRASKRPHAQVWLTLTRGPAPRISVVRRVRADGAAYLGPFPGAGAARLVAEVITAGIPIRTCTAPISRLRRAAAPGCLLADLRQCLAPCRAHHDPGHHDPAAYLHAVERVRGVFDGDAGDLIDDLTGRMQACAARGRYEQAADWRDRLEALVRAIVRTHRIRMLAQSAEIIAGRPAECGGWEVHCLRYGMLAGATTVAHGKDPRPAIESMVASAAVIEPPVGPQPAGLTEESRLLLDWLDTPGVRLVQASAPLAMPVGCGGAVAQRLADARSGSAVSWLRWPD